jgi:uncharacterized protein (DUF2235 family)
MAGKRIVICADGTWNSPYRSDASERCLTNVFKIAQAVKPIARDRTPQLVYYHPGVGTGWGRIDRVLGGGLGLGISRNIIDAYLFIVSNYEAGDEIFLFGFSRGAYTVRSLAGLIRNCGILRKAHTDRVQAAYDHYRDPDDAWHPSGIRAIEFRQRFSWREKPASSDGDCGRDSGITFLGVWDTVGALGVPDGILRYVTKRSYAFHDTQLSRWVDHAYHALALDEHRAPFYPTLWDPRSPRLPGQTIEQVWFAGAHSNVGGGYPDSGLSDIAFEWLADRARRHGLDVDPDTVHPVPDAGGVLVDSLTLGFRIAGVWGKLLDPLRRWWVTVRDDAQARGDIAIAAQTSWAGECVRPVGSGTSVHASVELRRRQTNYRPPNVPPLVTIAAPAERAVTPEARAG